MNVLKLFILSCFITTVLSCSGGGGASSTSAHYSISDHLDTLTQSWGVGQTVSKRVQISGREEEQIIDLKAFEKDLDFFKKLDISRRSFVGRYDVDTLEQSSGNTITYLANNTGAEIRTQRFTFDAGGGLSRFFSDRQYNSVVSDYDLKVEIIGDSVFIIDQTQDIPGKVRQNLLIQYTLIDN